MLYAPIDDEFADVLDRFEAFVAPEPTCGCWLWMGSYNSSGYGSFYMDGRMHGAHRIAYLIENGDIPDDLVVRHTCDVPVCVYPKHLLVGTPSDNQQDSVSRGRQNWMRKTHCPSGHAYTDDNLYVDAHGRRHCKTCRRLRMRERRRS